jgi:hypothetical protein
MTKCMMDEVLKDLGHEETAEYWRNRFGPCLSQATVRRKEWRFGVGSEPDIVVFYRPLCRTCARVYDAIKEDAALD